MLVDVAIDVIDTVSVSVALDLVVDVVDVVDILDVVIVLDVVVDVFEDAVELTVLDVDGNNL